MLCHGVQFLIRCHLDARVSGSGAAALWSQRLHVRNRDICVYMGRLHRRATHSVPLQNPRCPVGRRSRPGVQLNSMVIPWLECMPTALPVEARPRRMRAWQRAAYRWRMPLRRMPLIAKKDKGHTGRCGAGVPVWVMQHS
eukprot:jgi/Ulvmu1/3935/UM018_0158.1